MQDYRNLRVWQKAHKLTLNDLEYDLLLARDLTFLLPKIHTPLTEQLEEVRRMLCGLVERLTPTDDGC
jgi:hypothetical protein